LQTVKQKKYPAIFYVIALAIPALFFIIFEAALRFYDYDPVPPLFIPIEQGGYLTPNPEVALRYFDKSDEPPAPRDDLFLEHKPDDTLRIFLLGGSTAVGWPYAENMMPSRLLSRKLNQTFPEHDFEVVNIAFSAINTYSLLDFVDEVLAQSPDMVLIYSGHNEFYGAWGVGSTKSIAHYPWLVRSYLVLQHSKAFRLLSNTINALSSDHDRTVAGGSSVTLMQRMVDNADIPYGGEVYQAGLTQYESNLRRLIDRFQSAEVEVVISELVSNLRDQAPFVSNPSSGEDSAAEVYASAQQLEQQGRYAEARDQYRRAKDLDGLRFRAPQQFNALIQQVAAEYQVPVVPMQDYFEQASPNGIVGSNLMLEHLHPNVEGYFLFSEAFYDTLQQHSLLLGEWPAPVMDHQAFREVWPVTEYDRVMANLRIEYLKDHWPFQSWEQSGNSIVNYEPESDLAELAIQVVSGMIYPLDARLVLAEDYESQGDINNALTELQALLEMYPHNIDIYRQVAWLALKHEHLLIAQAILLRSLKIEEVAGAHKWLGQIYLRQAAYVEAISHFEQALALDLIDDPQLISLLSQAYVRAGQPDKAQAVYEMLPKESQVPAGAAD